MTFINDQPEVQASVKIVWTTDMLIKLLRWTEKAKVGDWEKRARAYNEAMWIAFATESGLIEGATTNG